MLHTLPILLTLLSLIALPKSEAAPYSKEYYASSLDSGELENEISKRLFRIAEFSAIRDFGEKNGLRIWVGGRTASDLAFYVRQDLENESSAKKNRPEKFKKDRYDYTLLSAIAPDEPLEVFVEGSKSKIELLKKFLKAHVQVAPDQDFFSLHWEIQPLPKLIEAGKSQKSITPLRAGLIEITDPPAHDRRVTDYSETQDQGQFLAEVASGEVSTAPLGKNFVTALDAIEDAARYGCRFSDPVRIESLIQEFDPQGEYSNVATENIFEKGQRIFSRALGMAEIFQWADRTGLRKKLIEFAMAKGNYPFASLLQKEPLPIFPIGKKGKTAAELGIKTVAHFTSSMPIYHTLVRSPSGRVNAFISRDYTWGELAVNGPGYYAYDGPDRVKASSKGLFAMSRMLPNARDGIDFFDRRHPQLGNEILIVNGASIENLEPPVFKTALDFFQKLDRGQIARENTAFFHATRSKLAFKLNHLSGQESLAIQKLVGKRLAESSQKPSGEAFPSVVEEWFSWDCSFDSPDLLDRAISIDAERALGFRAAHSGARWKRYLNLALKREYFAVAIQHYLSKPEAMKDGALIEMIDRMIENHYLQEVVEHILAKPGWFSHPRFPIWMDLAAESGNHFAFRSLGTLVLTQPQLFGHPEYDRWVKTAIDRSEVSSGNAFDAILSSPALIRDPRFGGWMARAIQKNPFVVSHYVLSDSPYLAMDPRFRSWINELIPQPLGSVGKILNARGMLKTPLFDELMNGLLEQDSPGWDTVDPLCWAVYLDKSDALRWVSQLFSKESISMNAYQLFLMEKIRKHPDYPTWLDAYFSKMQASRAWSMLDFFSSPVMRNEPNAARWLAKTVSRYFAASIAEGEELRADPHIKAAFTTVIQKSKRIRDELSKILELEDRRATPTQLLDQLIQRVRENACNDVLTAATADGS